MKKVEIDFGLDALVNKQRKSVAEKELEIKFNELIFSVIETKKHRYILPVKF